jgi:hypothetical protein
MSPQQVGTSPRGHGIVPGHTSAADQQHKQQNAGKRKPNNSLMNIAENFVSVLTTAPKELFLPIFDASSQQNRVNDPNKNRSKFESAQAAHVAATDRYSRNNTGQINGRASSPGKYTATGNAVHGSFQYGVYGIGNHHIYSDGNAQRAGARPAGGRVTGIASTAGASGIAPNSNHFFYFYQYEG